MDQKQDPDRLRLKLKQFAAAFAFYRLVGFELVEIEPGRSVCRVAFRPDLANPDGRMHGGVIATLIDAGITQALLMTDSYQQVRETKGTVSSVELRVKYLRPLREGAMTCESRITHLGNRIIHGEGTVSDEAGRTIATGDAIIVRTLGQGAPGEE
jgi:uncharacterized protein (TIGR00369 family)